MRNVRRTAPSPETLFKEEYPNAFADDDGSWVYIRNRTVVTEECPHCRRAWTHKVVDYSQTLGSGNCEAAAWEDAMKRLGS